MENKPQNTELIDLTPAFDTLPKPPREEKVASNSFRNQLISAFLYTVFIPLCVLFFLVQRQVQTSINSADTVLGTVADSLTTEVLRFVETPRKIIISTLVYGQGIEREQLDRIHAAEPAVQAIAIVPTGRDQLVFHACDPRKWPFPTEIPMHLRLRLADPGVSSFNASALGLDPNWLGIGFSLEDGRKAMALLDVSPLSRRIERDINVGGFGVKIHNNSDESVYSRNDKSVRMRSITESERVMAENSERAVVIHEDAPDNVASIRAVRIIPELQWSVLVAQSKSERTQKLRSTFMFSGCVVLIALLITAIIAYMIASPLTRSLNTLSDAVEHFRATGKIADVHKSAERSKTLEIINLSQRFASMAQSVSESQAKLTRLNAMLEQKIAERTQNLSARNRELQALKTLLIPLSDTGLKQIEDVVERFEDILGLSELQFVPSQSLLETITHASDAAQIIVVRRENQLLGYLVASSDTPLSQAVRESLQQLADSIAIALYNRMLVEEIAKERSTLKQVFESVTNGILILGQSGKVLYANETAATLLNEGKTIIGIDHIPLFAPWKPQTEGMTISSLTPGQKARFSRTLASRNQQVIDVVPFRVSHLPGLTGDRTGLLLSDVTRAAEIESIKDNLISVVAHELKTPVTSIQLQAELLARMDPENSGTSELLEEAQRLTRLIDDLLDVTRLESGTMRLSKRYVPIASLIDKAVKLTKSRYPIQVTRSIDPDAEVINADPDRISQVFINLFNNAARYKKPEQEMALCDVRVTPTESAVRITVTDQGLGISAKALPQIFQRFYQADMTATRKQGGTGLGLSIVDGIIRRHGGTIWAQSVPNEYTTFVIELPY